MELMYLLSSFILLQVIGAISGATNLLKNPDFEDDLQGNWYSDGCTVSRVTHNKVDGNYAAQVTGRTKRMGSIRQDVPVSGPGRMHFSIHVKLTNVFNDRDGHCLESYVYTHMKSSAGTMVRFGKVCFIFPNTGWVEIGGDFEVAQDAAKITLILTNDKTELNYLVDKAELVQLESEANWESKANARINQIRRGDITVNFKLASKYDPSKVKVLVTQDRHDFKFGFAVTASRIYGGDAASRKYQDAIYSLGNTATIANTLKWRFMESVEGQPSFTGADRAIEVLQAHNMTIRGHCLSWATESRVPSWMFGKSASETRDNLKRRVKYFAEHFRGKFAQYDMNNENLHGDYYEVITSDKSITWKMFQWMRMYDQTTDLCYNDYNVVSGGLYNMAYRFQAKRALSYNIPVNCLGIQGHWGANLPSPSGVLSRLDKLAELGLKMWVTELDVRAPDVNLRAEGMEQTLRLFFSHPAVEGIVIWGAWDLNNGGLPTALMQGENVVFNAAGNRVKGLINGSWKTRQTLVPSSRTASVTFPGFYGSYNVKVLYDGNQVSIGNFYIAKGHTASYQVNLQ